jgi:hypothetical protein
MRADGNGSAPLSRTITAQMRAPRPPRNLFGIALANKLARIAWAVLARGREYDPRIATNAA